MAYICIDKINRSAALFQCVHPIDQYTHTIYSRIQSAASNTCAQFVLYSMFTQAYGTNQPFSNVWSLRV